MSRSIPHGPASRWNAPGVALVLAASLVFATNVEAQVATNEDFKAQRALFNYDASIPLGVAEKGVEKRDRVAVRDVTFNALTGKDLAAYVVIPEGKGPFPAVLWVHWLGEAATTNRTEFLNEAVSLGAQGVASVLVDAMWSTAVNPDWFGKRIPEEDYANSIKQVLALRRAMDLLLAQPGVDKTRVGVVGHDYGGMYSMLMAGVDQRAKAYVYVAVVPSLNDWAFLGPQPKSKADYIRQNAALELTDYLRQVKNAATFLQFGAKDIYISRVDTGIIARAAGIAQKDLAAARKFYDTDHAMNLPEIAADRAAFLLRELGISPAAAAPAPTIK
jgi:dienelactone hydrolase